MKRLKDILRNHEWQLAFFGLTQVIILPLLFNTIYVTQYSSVGLYYNYASAIMDGSFPYRDFTVEYPPFALFFFILPRLFSSSFMFYEIAFLVEISLFFLLGQYFIYRIAQRTGQAPWKMLSVYTVATLALGPLPSFSTILFRR